jgi:flagellar motor switch protein FliN/FliY
MTPFDHIGIEISVLLGATHVPIHQLLRMGRGAVIELEARDTDEVQILANNIPVAKGQVVLRGDHVGVSITEVLFRAPAARAKENVRRIPTAAA